MRFFGLVIGILSICFSVYFTLLFWGKSQSYTAFEHPLLERVHKGDKYFVKIESQKDLVQVRGEQNLNFFLELSSTVDGQFLAIPQSRDFRPLSQMLTPESLGPQFKGNRTFFYDKAFLLLRYPELLDLQDLLRIFPDSLFILKILDNASQIHTHLIKIIEGAKAEKRVLIHSDIDVVLKSVKELKPTWLYGLSTPELNRWLSLESLGLEGVPQIRADVWVSASQYKNRPLMTGALREELKKRKKNLFLQIQNEEDYQQISRMSPDALIFSNASLLKNLALTR